MNPCDFIHVEVGQVWLYPSGGDVMRVTDVYPAIGEGSPTYTLMDLATGKEATMDNMAFDYYELRLLDEKDVPMALLGRD